MKSIVSAENPTYKWLVKLVHSSRERRKAGLSVLDGVHLVSAYLQNVGKPERVAVSRSGLENREIQSLLTAYAPAQALLLSDALFNSLSTVQTPTGVVAAIATPRRPVPPSHVASCLLLEDIQDPGNLGSILRSAAAAGMAHVFLSKGAVHAWSPRVLRAGMGAHFTLAIYEQADLAAVARSFSGRLVAATQNAGVAIFDVDLAGHTAFMFGNEGGGLSQSLLDLAHVQAAIPMADLVESLNVAAAAAICMFERVRQIRGAGQHELNRRA